MERRHGDLQDRRPHDGGGEANYLRDDGLNAEAYGATAYVLHSINPQWSANLRLDALRDPQGAFVVTYGSDTAFADAIRGVPALIYTAPPTTYGAVTAGVSYRPRRSTAAVSR